MTLLFAAQSSQEPVTWRLLRPFTHSTGQAPSALIPRTFLLLPPGPRDILLKVTEHGDATTQDREPVSDVYIAQHCHG